MADPVPTPPPAPLPVVVTPPSNPFVLLSVLMGWFTGRPDVHGFVPWVLFTAAWCCWTAAAFMTYKIPGALAVFGAGLMMACYIIDPPKGPQA